MADSDPYRGPSDEDDGELAAAPDQASPPGAPRWVKIFGIVGVVAVVLVAVMLLTGGAREHGPGRHSGGGEARSEGTGGQPPPAEGHTGPPRAGGHQPPPGGHAPPQGQERTP